ncbi:MAG TPA: molybdopterin-dependent oxidoreductase, partial [Thermoleophilaceae bacterium]|nr:molybdopterin-dependent oxidoreductase [Thermoleophilaceae bacterium]
ERAGTDRSGRDALRAAADALRVDGDVVVIWGERLSGGERGRQAVEGLIALAGALGLADREGSGLIEIPTVANGRGLREVGCLPGLGPGLEDADAAGMGGEQILAAAGDDVQALLLVHLDAERELPAATAEALGRATSVVAFADFVTDALEEHADVVFPSESYAEREGTVTHPDGRVQRVRQAVGHPGEVRPGWSVLAELCERLEAPLEVRSAASATAAVAGAIPFYADLGLDEIGGKGVRWQERGAASSLPVEQPSEDALEDPPQTPQEGMRVGAAPSLWSGRETRHAPSLRFLASEPHAELSPADARRLEVRPGDELVISMNGDSVRATAVVRSGVLPGTVFLGPGSLPAGAVEVTKA